MLQYDAVCCSVLQCVWIVRSLLRMGPCGVWLLKRRPVIFGNLLIRKRALYVSQKEPCISATEPRMSTKEAYNKEKGKCSALEGQELIFTCV